MMTVKTRFAPSPTGMLHIGGARTALFSWLYARHHQGEFVLRIEDTDLERSTPESVQAILDGMNWLELNWEGEPVYQTHRFERYREVVQQLLAEGKAYYCHCSRERLDALREQQEQSKASVRGYDGHCRELGLSASEGAVIRFKMPKEGEVVFEDSVQGEVRFQNTQLDDLVIMRADGSPTYNFCVVVDDLDMGITHVVRGDDHLTNTPRQIQIFRALGKTPPQYAHLAMILDEQGKKLSKRTGAASVMFYRDAGYLPEAVRNYLVRLGWSHGDQELFSTEEMIALFELDAINKSASSLNPSKLDWINQHYMKLADPGRLADLLRWQFEQANVDVSSGPALEAIVVSHLDRAKTLHEMMQQSRFFYEEFEEYDAKAAKKALVVGAVEPLSVLREKLTALGDWRAEPIHAVVNDVCEILQVGMGKVGQPLRVAVAGSGSSPSIDITLELLGKEKTLARIDRALAWIASQ
jgi:glutamyl-tRNA synthetase